MSMPVRVSAFPMILMAALTACGGGGGGGGGVIAPAAVSSGAPAEVAFTSFSGIAPNQTVVMSGLSQSQTGSGTDIDLDPVGSTAKLTYDADRNLTGISFSTPQSSVAFGA